MPVIMTLVIWDLGVGQNYVKKFWFIAIDEVLINALIKCFNTVTAKYISSIGK